MSATDVTIAELLAMRTCWANFRYRRSLAVTPAAGMHRAGAGAGGLEFAGSRPYVPGDDPRTLDWRQTARRGRPYTRMLQDEREQPLCLLVDQGPSMQFATRCAFKSVVAARAAALLAWRARRHGDRIGGVVWREERACLLPARRGERGVLALLQALAGPLTAGEAAASASGITSLSAALTATAVVVHTRTRLVVLSDFYTLDNAATPLLAQLRALTRRHALCLIHVFDPLEAATPDSGIFPVSDGARRLLIDFSRAASRMEFVAPHRARCRVLRALAQETGAAYVPLATDALLERELVDVERRPVRPQ